MPPVITRPYYQPLQQWEAVDLAVGLHRWMGNLCAQFTRRNYRIELTVMVLSVVTSGGIWVLLAASYPQTAAWFGAAFSTIVTFFTIYQLSFGPKQRVRKAYDVYEAIAREVSRLRGGNPVAFDPRVFWDNYKSLEVEVTKLENPSVGP
jgi:hypothetical protein